MGARGPTGEVVPGWKTLGLPTETATAQGKSYDALRRSV